MTKRWNDDDILSLIEGGNEEALERLAAEDPQLARWVQAAKRDRSSLESLEEGIRAPEGLVDDALSEAERRALVGVATHAPHAGREGRAGRTPAGHRRFRVTPLRLTIAAGLFIAAGAATVLPVLIGQPGQGIGSSGPVAMQDPEPTDTIAAEPDDALAMADDVRSPLNAARSMVEDAKPVSTNADDSVGRSKSPGSRETQADQADARTQETSLLPTAEESEWLALAMEGRLGVIAPKWSGARLDEMGARVITQSEASIPGVRAVALLEIDAVDQRLRDQLNALRDIGGESARVVAFEGRSETAPAMEPEEVFWWTQRSAFTPRERVSVLLLSPRPSGE